MRRLSVLAALAAVCLVAPAAADAPPERKPVVRVEGTPPQKLKKTDIKRGTGRVVRTGMTVAVRYVGVGWKTKKQFDSNWGDRLFEFEVGAGDVIEGWDRGVPGMRVGGRRRLDIPPAQAYGAEGSPPVIVPNETLAFVVDVVRICRSPGRCAP